MSVSLPFGIAAYDSSSSLNKQPGFTHHVRAKNHMHDRAMSICYERLIHGFTVIDNEPYLQRLCCYLLYFSPKSLFCHIPINAKHICGVWSLSQVANGTGPQIGCQCRTARAPTHAADSLDVLISVTGGRLHNTVRTCRLLTHRSREGFNPTTIAVPTEAIIISHNEKLFVTLCRTPDTCPCYS